MNENTHIVFVLQGLNHSLTNRQICFALAMMSYLFTIFVNLTLILTVCLDKTLHQPMHFVMCNLIFTRIYGASGFYPKLLIDLLADAHDITYVGCLTQMLIFYSYIFCQLTSLIFMAYHHYLAICQPLRYWAVMTGQKVALLLLFSWCLSLLETAVGLVLITRLPLCSHHINRLFCTRWEVVKLSCSDTNANNLYGFLLNFLLVMLVVVILAAYVPLIRTAIRSQADRRKFARTNTPHLVSLLVFAILLPFDPLYSRYGRSSVTLLQNMLTTQLLVVPPVISPIMCGMNLKQIRTASLSDQKTFEENPINKISTLEFSTMRLTQS